MLGKFTLPVDTETWQLINIPDSSAVVFNTGFFVPSLSEAEKDDRIDFVFPSRGRRNSPRTISG